MIDIHLTSGVFVLSSVLGMLQHHIKCRVLDVTKGQTAMGERIKVENIQ